MKNPIQKLFKQWHLDSEMYSELTRIRKRFDKEFHSISKKFNKELASLEKKAKGRKLKLEEELKVWRKSGYDRMVKELRKKADAVMDEVRKDYRLAVKKLGR